MTVDGFGRPGYKRPRIDEYTGYLQKDQTLMGRVERTREIARRRIRRVKLKKLRSQYAEAKTESAKADIKEKLRKLSPLASLD